MSYCTYVATAPADSVHRPYHDTEYGFPLKTDAELLGRLILEINQAGLSWELILKRKDGFYKAYDGYDPEKLANYGAKDRERLLNDPSVIRNRLKIDAAISNAQKILEIRESHGSFLAWIDAHHPLTKEEWVKVFKKTFRFTGGAIVNEFLMSIGYLPGAHDEDCRVYQEIAKLKPAWMR